MLQSGRADIISSSISITDERRESIDFPTAHYTGGVSLLVRAEDLGQAVETEDSGFLAGLAGNFYRNFIEANRWQMVLSGLGVTCVISVFSALFGTVLGFGLCLIRRSRSRLASGITAAFIRFIQGIPVLVLLMVLFYVVFAQSQLSGVVVSIVAFSINFAVYVSEMIAHPDGVDYVPMKTWRVFLIQLLNIAGTGPIFGPLMGAVFGPVVFLWIVLGAILGGAVHDYMSGMISVRMNGASVSEIVGKYLGNTAKQIMRVFSVILLILCGAVFTTSPAALLARLTPEWMDAAFWVVVILIYYFLATLLPIDKLIGKLYPVFGVVLTAMAVGIIGGLIAGGYTLPELELANLHPDGLPIWPYMFVTVACGAISGFHVTQSPLMARCIRSEKNGRVVFYGAMIAESVIAMVWAAAGVAFYGTTGGLQAALADLGQSGVVYDVSVSVLGIAGGALAIVGVVVCPVSSGDTAFRSARLTIADWFHIDQTKIGKRLAITIPLLAAGAVLTQLDFDVIWRYFSWSNQTLAMIIGGAVSERTAHRYFNVTSDYMRSASHQWDETAVPEAAGTAYAWQ